MTIEEAIHAGEPSIDPSLTTLLAINTSNHVYVRSKEYAWVPARLLEAVGTTATVSIPHYKDEQSIQSDGGRGAKRFEKATVELSDYPAGALLLQNVDEEGHLKEVEDMVDLPFLHEVSPPFPVGVEFLLWSYHTHDHF